MGQEEIKVNAMGKKVYTDDDPKVQGEPIYIIDKAEVYDDSSESEDPEDDGAAVEAMANGVGPTPGTGNASTLSAGEAATQDPYAATRKATEDMYKSFRQLLSNQYKAREEARTKRQRKAEIVGLGHALGQMISGIWGGVDATKNRVQAIVPQSTAAQRSYEKLQQLLKEGIVAKEDYDKMITNIAMQEEQSKVNMVRALEDIGIRRQEAELSHQREMEKLNTQHQNRMKEIGARSDSAMALAVERGKSALAVAGVNAAGKQKKTTFTELDVAILGAIVPEKEEYEKTVTKTGEGRFGNTTRTATTKEQKAPDMSENALKVRLVAEKQKMRRMGYDPDKKDDVLQWVKIRLLMSQHQKTESQMMKALKSGFTLEELEDYFINEYDN